MRLLKNLSYRFHIVVPLVFFCHFSLLCSAQDNTTKFPNDPMAKQTKFPAEDDHEFDQGSAVQPIQLDRNKQKALRDLCLIWGFLKYYHPQVTAGNFNWDYALFRMLPKVIAAQDQKHRDKVLTAWIKTLGTFEINDTTVLEKRMIKQMPDLAWIDYSGFSSALQQELTKISKAKRNDYRYYIGQVENIGNPLIKHENPYPDMDPTDVGYRILSLYRYWNIIAYYFPYKNLIGKDWKEVLDEFIPKMVSANDAQSYTLTILELIGNIHDTHANIWGKNEVLDKFRGKQYAACYLDFIERKAVVTGYHDKKKGLESGLVIGDVVTHINGKSIDEIISGQLQYRPASNNSTQLRDIANDLLRSNDSTIKVSYQHGTETHSTSIYTFPPGIMHIYGKYLNKDTCFRMLTPDIAYLNNGSLKRTYLPQLAKEINQAKGLIIDCRNYPSDFPFRELSNYLLPQSMPFNSITLADFARPGLFYSIGQLKIGAANPDYYKGKVIILVNENSQSAAEYSAMAYSTHPHAKVMGSTTAAADGDVSRFYLPGQLYTMFSGIGICYPNGDETQRSGIKIDIPVSPTIRGIIARKDELLDHAIQYLQQAD